MRRTPSITLSAAPVPKRSKKTTLARKRRGNDGSFLNVPRGFAFPKLYKNTHTYWENLAIQTSIGTGLASYLFSCNGLFDPNITGTGHQPMYFDQMTAIYDHYNVVSAKITWYIANADNYPTLCMFGIDDDASPALSNAAIGGERPGSQTRILTQYTPVVFTQYWSRLTAFGKNRDADPELQGTSSANPTETQNFWILLYDNAVGNKTYNVTVKIEYLAEWSEFASIGLS